MIFKRVIALLLLLLLTCGAFACNKNENEESGTPSGTSEATEAATEKETKKPSSQKETEAPKKLENTEGLDLTLKIMSQDLGITDRSGTNSIEERSLRFGAMIEEYAPDIIGTQEASIKWITYLKKLDNYGVVGMSNEGKRTTGGAWNAILYNKDRFVLMDEDTFWLSSSPNSDSRHDGANSNRICTWAELFDTYTGRTLIMANTQLDFMTPKVREEQANILMRHLKSELGDRYTQCMIYLTCSLNGTEDEMAHTVIYDRAFVDVRDLAKEDASAGKGTYHSYGNIENGKEIDFCFHRGNDEVLSYQIIDKKYTAGNDTEAGFVSDHYAILVTFEMAE